MGIRGMVSAIRVISASARSDQPGFAETRGILPIPSGFVYRVACGHQCCHVLITCPSGFGFGFVENVGVMAETGRILPGVEHQATGKVALLAAIGSQDLHHLLLERS